MKVVSPQVHGLLRRFPDVPPPPEWHIAEPGERLPTSAGSQVLASEVVLHVAAVRRQRALEAFDPERLTSLPDHALRLDGAERWRFRSPPDRFAYQLDVHRAIFYEDERGVAVGRSGVVVLPCGAGKTHIAKLAVLTVRRPTLVLVHSNEVAEQTVAVFASAGVPVHVCGKKGGAKLRPEAPPGVTLCTYTRLAGEHRLPSVATVPWEMQLALYTWEYELVVFDEVWKISAETYLRACAALRCKMRLGLTADERRRDGLQVRFQALVGPTLYEMAPQKARELGIIATTTHRVVELPLGPEGRRVYAAASDPHTGCAEVGRLVSVLNPHKVHAMCAALVESTDARRVAIFCDKLAALPLLADLLRTLDQPRPFVGTLTSGTPVRERRALCERLRALPSFVVLFSAAADTGLDVPGIDLSLVMSVVDRSAQHKTQRDGRGQRVCEGKAASEVRTFVSQGTREVDFAVERNAGSRSGTEVAWVTPGTDVPSHLCPWTDAQLPSLLMRLGQQEWWRSAWPRCGKRKERESTSTGVVTGATTSDPTATSVTTVAATVTTQSSDS